LNILEASFGSNASETQTSPATAPAADRPVGLVLASHYPLTLCGLSQVFEKRPEYTVAAVCSDAEAAVDAVVRHRPDIVILDFDGHAALKTVRRIQRTRVPTRIVVLVAASDDNEMTDVLRLGARAVVLKQLPPDEFVESIRKVHEGERSVDGEELGKIVGKLFRPGTPARQLPRQLTPREAEIARLALLGISTRDIAARLEVKQGTVKIHLHSIYEKLNVGGRLGLILFARRHGFA
jgi:DNA-binding NarL/FixJ family response regulator